MPGGPSPPPEVIASWPKPNYINPETRGVGLVVVTWVLGGLTILTVSARLWSRVIVLRSPGKDDYVIIPATLAAIVFSVAVSLGTLKYSWNRHVWDIPPSAFVPSFIQVWLAGLSLVVGISLTKISILLFYQRVLSRTCGNLFRIANTSLLIIIASFALAWFITGVFSCWPIDAYWLGRKPQPGQKAPKCINEPVAHMVTGSINNATDFLCTLLPLLFLRHVQIPRRQKLALGVLFGLGFTVCIAGIIRLVYIYTAMYGSYDVTWYTYQSWIWCSIELNLALICASAPALKAYFHRSLDDTTYGSAHKRGRSHRMVMGCDGYQRSGGDFDGIVDPKGKNLELVDNVRSDAWDADSRDSATRLQNPDRAIYREVTIESSSCQA